MHKRKFVKLNYSRVQDYYDINCKYIAINSNLHSHSMHGCHVRHALHALNSLHIIIEELMIM